jgi:PTH1 family peptidyl-tRNA hydrolase
MIKYVIGNVSESDKKILDEATTIAKDAVIEILENGVDKAMNKYN